MTADRKELRRAALTAIRRAWPITPGTFLGADRRWRGRDCKINDVTLEMEEAPVTTVTMDVSAELSDGVNEQLVRQLVDRARAEGLKLTGEGSLLAQLTKAQCLGSYTQGQTY